MTELAVYGRSFRCTGCLETFPAAARGRLPTQCDNCIIAGGGRIRRSTQTAETRQKVRSPNKTTLQVQQQALRALEMRRDGFTFEDIAEHCGYADRSGAYRAVKREQAIRQEQISQTVDELRQQELERLEHYSAEALKVLQSEHLLVQSGGVVLHGGQPMHDQGPILAAIDRLVKVSESRRKLLGLDAATKSEVNGQVAFTVQGIAEGDMP